MLRIGTVFSNGVDWFVVVDIWSRWNFITRSHEGMVSVRKNADGATAFELRLVDLPQQEFQIANSPI